MPFGTGGGTIPLPWPRLRHSKHCALDASSGPTLSQAGTKWPAALGSATPAKGINRMKTFPMFLQNWRGRRVVYHGWGESKPAQENASDSENPEQRSRYGTAVMLNWSALAASGRRLALHSATITPRKLFRDALSLHRLPVMPGADMALHALAKKAVRPSTSSRSTPLCDAIHPVDTLTRDPVVVAIRY